MKWFLATLFIAFSAYAFVPTDIYRGGGSACTQDADADTAQDNRLGPFTKGYYVLYCHDGSGAGSACECLTGGSTIDASAAVGQTIFAGEKVIIYLQKDGYVSCVPFANNQLYDVCPLP